ncbi:hypothetical protein ACIBKY_05025 [Nonomuraea sp. NPDC050394]|uniref:hypothetical protein n=1 Tax=Nonomuraea sp. NPDC050394 TaxID=3364363 RepID=UPI00379DF5A5
MSSPALLSSLLGVAVAEWVPVEPWAVARVRLGDGRWVVAKWDRGFHLTVPAETRLAAEAAALRFLAEDAGVLMAPRMLAAGGGLVVMEDLSPRVAVDGLVRRDGSAAHRERLVAFAQARGALGAVSAGRLEAFYARRGQVDRTVDVAGQLAGLRDAGLAAAADLLEAPMAGRALAEWRSALEALADPGPFLTLSNGDAEANNCLVAPGGDPDARLIDFEFAGFRHALHDAVCLVVPGPGWLSVADRFGLVAEFRRALALGVPAAEDDQLFGAGLAAACVAFAAVRSQRLGELDRRAAGDGSRVQLVAVTEAAAGAAQDFLPALASWWWRVSAALRRRWPDADVDVTALPPYTPRPRP